MTPNKAYNGMARRLRRNLDLKSPHPGKSGDELEHSPVSRRQAQSSIDGPGGSKEKYNTARRLNPLNNSVDTVFN